MSKRPVMKKYLYTGPITAMLQGFLLSGYTSFRAQKQRCNNPKNESYKTSGAIGIRVRYTAHEFLGWWLVQMMEREYTQPVCGRIDHSKDYEFGNIRIEERAENSREVMARRGTPVQEVVVKVICPMSGATLQFASIRAAARAVGVPTALLALHLAGKMNAPHPNFRFESVEATKAPRNSSRAQVAQERNAEHVDQGEVWYFPKSKRGRGRKF